MTGVEFLARALAFAPEAKRVLLTAYADTDAAIRAINEVRLDHYLMKPWNPPEELLYPVLDDLLDDWQANVPRGRRAGVRVVGHRWSAEAHARARLPRPQPVPVPLAGRRRTRRPRGCCGRRASRRAAAARRLRGRQAARAPRPRPTSPSASACARAAELALLRPRDRRRRPGRSRRRGLRRLGGPAHRCSSSATPPAARPARARASRTTSASRPD